MRILCKDCLAVHRTSFFSWLLSRFTRWPICGHRGCSGRELNCLECVRLSPSCQTFDIRRHFIIKDKPKYEGGGKNE